MKGKSAIKRGFFLAFLGISTLFVGETKAQPETDTVEANSDTTRQQDPGNPSATKGATETENPEDPSPEDTILVSFSKKNTKFSLDSMYINVIRIVNRKASPVSGQLNVTKPEDWNLIGRIPERATIAPGDTFFFPVRMSIPRKAIGGGTYVLNAEFRVNGKIFTGNSYTTIPKKTEWSINIKEQTIFFSQYKEFVKFDVKLQNNGNSIETLKLDYQIGEQLVVDEFQNAPPVLFVELSPRSDTILTHTVRYQEFQSQRERFFSSGWRSKAISVKASTSKEEKKESVWFRKLESQYEYKKGKRASPLNLGIRGFNFLSPSVPKLGVSAFGRVLFPQRRTLNYRIRANNVITLAPDQRAIQPVYLNRSTFFNIRYKAPEYSIAIGDQVGNNSLHYLFGTTGRFAYDLDSRNRVAVFGSRNRFHPTYGGGGRYFRTISENYSVDGGVIYENNGLNNLQATSFQLGQNISLQNVHDINLDLLVSDLNYRDMPEVFPGAPRQDTAITGIGYKARYQYDPDENYRFSISNRNMKNNPVNRTQRSYWRANGKYRFNRAYDLRVRYDRRERDLGRFPENFFTGSGSSRNQNGRATLNIRKNNNQTYLIGPRFASYERERFHKIGNFKTRLKNNRYTLLGGTRIKLDPIRFITPRIELGLSNTFINSTDTSRIMNFSKTGNFVTSASLIYSGNYFKFHGSLRRGPINLSTADFARSREAGSVSREVVVLRPDYVREFQDGKYKLNAGFHFLHQLPSKQSNFNLRTRGSAKFDKGWTVSLAFNFFSNTSPRAQGGQLRRSRSTNVMFRVNKAFDIPQPRIKFHDLDIVFFEDQNGDGKKNEPEAPVGNIMTRVTKKPSDSGEPDMNFPYKELISSTNGKVSLKKIPKGSYQLKFQPLENLHGWYFKNGSEQNAIVQENTTFYVPLVETFKVKGKIVVNKAQYTKHEDLDLSRIRVTATDTNGNEISTLTKDNGYYILDIPGSGTYDIRVKNALGKDFIPVKTKYRKIQFNGVKSINLNFKFKEKRRDINFRGGNDRLEKIRDSLNIGDRRKNSGQKENRPGTGEGPEDGTGTEPQNEEEIQEAEKGEGNTPEESRTPTDTSRETRDDSRQGGDLAEDSYEVLDSLVGELLAKGIADQGQRQKVIEQAMKANQSSELAAAFEPDLSPDTMAEPLDSARVGFLIDLGVNPDETSFEEVSDLIDSDFTRVDTIAGGRNRYTVGPYDSFESALQRQKELRDQGFEQTYMTGSYNDQRIRLEDALEAKGELED